MIIITAPVHVSFLQTLQQKNILFEYLPNIGYHQLTDKIEAATGLVVSTQINVDQTLIDMAQKLQWIGRLGSGMEHIDVTYAQQKGIRCISSPEGNSNAVAEMALGGLLNLLRNINKSSLEVKQELWKREENRGMEIGGKTIGIIGYGNTGSRFAQLLSSFGCTILVYDKYKTEFNHQHILVSTLNEIQQKADVISLHLPLNDETRYLCGNDFFNDLQQAPVLINTSRGGIIDTSALVNALEKGTIKGAVLDVLENEKLATLSSEQKIQFNFLNHHPSVLITPHIAGYTQESFVRLGTVLLEKLGIM